MKNCLVEVKRDVMYKNSQNKSTFAKTIGRHQSAVDLIADPDDTSNFSIRTDSMNLKQKYDLVQKFLSHELVLERLKDIIDNELALSEVFVYPESNQIKRDVLDLRDVRLKSANHTS